jgi:RNA polymerase sigma factor (sigma-70 family)
MRTASYMSRWTTFQCIELTQEEMIQGCIRQKPAAQKALFDSYACKMMGVSLRYARNEADAEDILQDAFIKVFRKISQYQHNGSFEGWIRKIVVNTALKKYSVNRYAKERNLGDINEYEHLHTEDPEVYTDLSEKEILEMIHTLPDGYRMVFNLYVIEGYRHEEIAEMMGIQSGTSRSQLAKARWMLQKQIIERQKITV